MQSANWTSSLGFTTVNEVTNISVISNSNKPLFPTINAIFENGNIDIEAAVATDLQSVISYSVGLATDNSLLLDTDGPSLSDIVATFQNASANISSIGSFSSNMFIDYDATMMCGKTAWYSAMVGCSQLEFSTTPTVFEFRQSVAQYLTSLCEGTNTSLVVTLQTSTSSSFAISIITTTTNYVSLLNSGNPWEQITDTGRFVIPLIIRASLQLQVDHYCSGVFEVLGENTVEGWTLPFTYNMLLGSATGLMGIVLDLPSQLSITSEMNVSSSFGEQAQSSIIVLVDSSNQQVQFAVNTTSTLQISSTFVIHNLVDGLFNLLPNAMKQGATADITVGSAFQTPFASQNTFSQLVSYVEPWLSIPANPVPLLMQSQPVCLQDTLNNFLVNVSVNQMATIQCMHIFPFF